MRDATLTARLVSVPHLNIGPLHFTLMPYRNIVFVKLEKRLLNDYRWFAMSDKAQLLYIKLILAAAETGNKLPTNWTLLRRLLHLEWKLNVFQKAMTEIVNNFPKFRKDGEFYFFEEFESKTNYIRECPGSARGVPKDGIDKEKEIDIDKEKDIRRLEIYYQDCIHLPKYRDKQFIAELYEKYGYIKSREIINQYADNNFHTLQKMRDALNPDGSIKPKESKVNSPVQQVNVDPYRSIR